MSVFICMFTSIKSSKYWIFISLLLGDDFFQSSIFSARTETLKKSHPYVNKVTLSHTLTLLTRRKLTGYKPIQPVPMNIYCTYQSVFKKPTISVQSLVLLLPVIVARILNTHTHTHTCVIKFVSLICTECFRSLWV